MTLPLSLNLLPAGRVAELAELGALTEELGYRRCWICDEGLATRDVYVTLAAIAARTETIKLGPGITNPYVRHPGATATAVATLDELSGRRAFVGVGAGGALTLDPLGIERHRPVTAVRQTVEALRGLFAGERVDIDGEVFSFRNAHLDYGRSDIEIILAGRGPKMRQLGGAVADGFTLSYIHKEMLGPHAAALREAVAENERPFVITYSTMVASTDAEFDDARAALTFRLVDSPPAVREMIGMTDTDVTSIREALGRGGPHAAAPFVKEEWVPQFVITGTWAEAGKELRLLMSTHDIDEFQLPVHGVTGASELIEQTAAAFRTKFLG